jgi:anaerobic magnesium-protoporphyrin IX monomethyl ester cyclase
MAVYLDAGTRMFCDRILRCPARRVRCSLLRVSPAGIKIRRFGYYSVMARVVLISLYSRWAINIASLSSFLKERGHQVRVIFFKKYGSMPMKLVREEVSPLHHVMVSNTGKDWVLSYQTPPTTAELESACKLIEDFNADVVGVSVATVASGVAARLTDFIRARLRIPIVWGGIEPTIEPEKSLDVADAVCTGEGEDALDELAARLDKERSLGLDVANVWVREADGSVRKNPVRPLRQDLDTLPFLDCSPEEKFYVEGDRIVEGWSIAHLGGLYETMTARGCPFSCAYCYNDQLRRLYAGQRFVRRRSPGNVIEELVSAQREAPIKFVNFQDDVFTFDRAWVAEFARSYKNRVGVPFWCYSHALHTDFGTFELLRDAGLRRVTIGIQSGSQRILKEVFNRPIPNRKILESARILERIGVEYDFDIITNTPFETEQDCMDTLELLLSLPRVRFDFGLSKLSIYPKTEVERLYMERKPQSLSEATYDFYNKLYLLTQVPMPRTIVRALGRSRYLKKHHGLLRIPLLLWYKMRELREAVTRAR